MSQSAAPAKQNDMTTCLKTFEKERFCSFPHRHGEATGKLETRDETRGRSKANMSCETSANFDTLQLQNRNFPTTNFPSNLKICYLKIDGSREASVNFQPQNRWFARGFRQFQHISENATPATEFAPCRHLTQP